MEREKGSRKTVGAGDERVPLPAVVGPLKGLLYVLIIPPYTVVAILLATAQLAAHGLATLFHRTPHVPTGI